MSKSIHGAEAIAAARAQLGRELDPYETQIVMSEGYNPGLYDDINDVPTAGFGQTGEYMGMPLDQVVNVFKERASKVIPGYENLPEEVKLRMFDSTYRGGITGSPKTLEHIKNGDWAAASKEFLDNNEYRRSVEEKTGVATRMDETALVMKNYADQLAAQKVQEVPAVGLDATFQGQSNTGGVPVVPVSPATTTPPRVDADPSRSHEVVRGNTLKGIARDYGVTVEQLMAHNNIKDPNKIYVGQIIQTVPSISGLTPAGIASSGRQIYNITDLNSKSKGQVPMTETAPPKQNSSDSLSDTVKTFITDLFGVD